MTVPVRILSAAWNTLLAVWGQIMAITGARALQRHFDRREARELYDLAERATAAGLPDAGRRLQAAADRRVGRYIERSA